MLPAPVPQADDHETDHERAQGQQRHVFVLLDDRQHLRPVLAEQHPHPHQQAIPDQRAQRRGDQEAAERHAVHPGRDRDQTAHHRHQPPKEDHHLPIAAEEAHGAVQVAFVQQQVAPIAPHEGPDDRLVQPRAQSVQHQRPEDRAQRPGQQHAAQTQIAVGHQKPGQRHHQLGGDRRKHVLREHDESDARITQPRDDLLDEHPHLLKKFGQHTLKSFSIVACHVDRPDPIRRGRQRNVPDSGHFSSPTLVLGKSISPRRHRGHREKQNGLRFSSARSAFSAMQSFYPVDPRQARARLRYNISRRSI